MADTKTKPEKESKALVAAKSYVAALPEKQRKAYAPILADPEAAEQLGNSVLMQADYTRGIQEARAKAKEAEELHKRLLDQKKGLDQWRAENVDKVDKILAENEKFKTKSMAYETRMERLRTKYGFSEDEIKDLVEKETGEGQGPGAQPKVENLESGANVGSGKGHKQYIDRETFDQSLNSNISLSAQFHDIQADHAELFPGQRLKMTELLKEANQYANEHPDEQVTLQSFWETKHKVAERRAELANEAFEEKVTKQVEERWQAKVSEAAANGVSFDGRSPGRASEGSPMLEALKPKVDEDGKPILSEPGNPNRGVEQAIKMWQSGETQKQLAGVPGNGSA